MKKRIISIGNLHIGGDYPVRVESMLKVPLSAHQACREQINTLHKAGCELIRVAFPTLELEPYLRDLVDFSPVPLMADIHFNYKLAVAAIRAGCPSVRLNPGNMGTSKELDQVVELAKERKVVIRIGANSGSLNREYLEKAEGDLSLALVLAVEEQLQLLLSRDFYNLILSSKSTSIGDSLRSNYLLSRKYGDFPFHIGITEAGPGMQGIVKSTCGLSLLLSQNIGDTLRVSLTNSPEREVETGFEILRSLGLRHHGPEIISCPTCGRKRVDVRAVIDELSPLLKTLPDGFRFAVMGCEVNGPREAKGADLGIAGTQKGLVIFRNGQVIADGDREDMKTLLKKIISEIISQEHIN